MTRFKVPPVVFVGALLSAGLLIAIVLNSAIPPLFSVDHIEVTTRGPGSLYNLTIHPDGSATLLDLGRNAPVFVITHCPANTFNFGEVYNDLSNQPESRQAQAPFLYGVGFSTRRRGAEPLPLIGGYISDPEVVQRLFETVEGPSLSEKQIIQKYFSDSPPFPPVNN